MSKRDEMMRALSAWRFAAMDMFLYMDTHPHNEKAKRLYREFATQAQNLHDEYVKIYGPLTAADVAKFGGDWIKAPWPWENMEEVN